MKDTSSVSLKLVKLDVKLVRVVLPLEGSFANALGREVNLDFLYLLQMIKTMLVLSNTIRRMTYSMAIADDGRGACTCSCA